MVRSGAFAVHMPYISWIGPDMLVPPVGKV